MHLNSSTSRNARRRSWSLRRGGVAAVLSAAAVVATGGPLIGYLMASPETAAAVASADPSYARSLSAAFRSAAETALPSVVTIHRVASSKPVEGDSRWRRDGPAVDPFEELFRSPFWRRFSPDRRALPPSPGLPSRPRQTSGSGVIIDASGTILTNNHVVEGGGDITVRLRDGREFKATKVKTDPRTDLAVVWIEASERLPAAQLGDSDTVRIGDWVLALGQPFGLEDSVTAGIISAKDRGVGLIGREEFLQTDAAINPGNSGGPLIDLDGRVIGINTAISSMSGGFQGVGFAVPINLARWVSDQLVQNGVVRRAFLGVMIQSVTPELARQFGSEVKSGAAITQVLPNTPSARAGLRAGDVVVDFDGTVVADARDLQAAVERTAIGSTKRVGLYRDGKRIAVDVLLEEQPDPTALAQRGTGASSGADSRLEELGIEVEQLTESVARQLGLEDVEGVVITAVRPESPAARAGLAPAMVITRVGRDAVRTTGDVERALASGVPAQGILLLVRDQRGARFVVVQN